MLLIRLLAELLSPIACRLRWHYWYDTEQDVPFVTLEEGWILYQHGQGTPCQECYWCGRTRPRKEDR